METDRWLRASKLVYELPKETFQEKFRQADAQARRDLLHARFRHDRAAFLRWCLPTVFDSPWNPYHLAVLARDKHHWARHTGTKKTLNLAPRGVGKSTLKKGDVAHSVCYGLRRFIIVVGPTQPDAAGWAATLRAWFSKRTELNAPMWDLYGPFKVTGNVLRFTVEGPLGKTTIRCASTATSLQGDNEETHRPDEVILDDWEDRKKVKNPELREQWQAKLNQEILKLGDRRRGVQVESNVTVNHPDQPSQRIREGKSPNVGWRVNEFPALFRWPDNMALWERCKRIYCDLTIGDPDVRETAARAFYEVYREEMDAGAEVLDPHAQPLFALFCMLWGEGRTAFYREMLHVVRVPGDSLYDSSTFARCRVEKDRLSGELVVVTSTGRRVPLSEMVSRTGRWDPAKGTKAGKGGRAGDFAALAVLLRDQHGYSYVVDCWLKRAPVSVQIEAAWRLAEKWGLTKFSLESNGFQYLIEEVFNPSRKKRKEAGLYHSLVLELDPSSENKEDRLAGMEPAITSQVIEFAQHLPPALFQAYDDFDGVPNSHHDDGPDAVQGAFARSGGMPPMMVEQRLR